MKSKKVTHDVKPMSGELMAKLEVIRRAPRGSTDLIHPRRAKPFHRDGWMYAKKYHGWRIAAIKERGASR